MFHAAGLFLSILVLTGCAALDLRRSVSSEDIASTKRIGVVSWLGDTFYGTSIGTTVFNNEYFSAPVPEWNINAYATAKALEALKANRHQAAALDLSGLDPKKQGVGKDSMMWEAAQKQGFDKLVILSAGVSDNMRFFKPGFGLQERSLLLMTPSRCVYVGYVASVYDVATRNSVGWEWGGGEYPCEPKSSNDLPFKKLFSDYSVAEQRLFRERVEKRIADTVPYTFGELALIPQRPASK